MSHVLVKLVTYINLTVGRVDILHYFTLVVDRMGLKHNVSNKVLVDCQPHYLSNSRTISK